jgi:hypothetical protein
MADKAMKAGLRRQGKGAERPAGKARDIMRLQLGDQEFVTRVLAIRPVEP